MPGGDRCAARASRARRRSASSAAASSSTRLRRFDRLVATLPGSLPRSASSFRTSCRSVPFAAASASRSTKTGVLLFLPALIASAGPRRRLDREAHHGLVDASRSARHRACGRTAARRPPARHQPVEDAQDAAVRHRRRMRGAIVRRVAGLRGRESRRDRTACRRAPIEAGCCRPCGSGGTARAAGPSRRALVHRVGMSARRPSELARRAPRTRIALLVERAAPRSSVREGMRSRSSA